MLDITEISLKSFGNHNLEMIFCELQDRSRELDMLRGGTRRPCTDLSLQISNLRLVC